MPRFPFPDSARETPWTERSFMNHHIQPQKIMPHKAEGRCERVLKEVYPGLTLLIPRPRSGNRGKLFVMMSIGYGNFGELRFLTI